MSVNLSLADLKPGDQAVICGFGASEASYRHQLLALGLTLNTTLTVVRVAPLGDPIELRVDGQAIALRRKEARSLRVKKIETSL